MNEDFRFKVMKMKITDEKILFDILANPEKYQNLKDVEFDDGFLDSIKFKLKIEGTTLDNIPIQGHITTDLLNVCNAWQDAINKMYASVVKGRNDARGKILNDDEKRLLTLVFQIQQGSTTENVQNLKDILNIFKNMDTTKACTLIGGCVLIAGFYFGYKAIENNNDKAKFLAQNETINKTVSAFQETVIAALNTSKFKIDKATIGDTELNKQEIEEISEIIKNKQTETTKEYKNDGFIVKKLDTKNGKKVATLKNNQYEIDVDFVANLFEDNETLLLQSYAKSYTSHPIQINCELLVVKDVEDNIVEATVTKLNQLNTPKPNQNS